MQNMNGGDEETEMQKQLLEQLMDLAKGGMAKDMRQRYGKPPADAPAEEEMPAEDPEIPGAEASEGDDAGAELEAGEEQGGSMDPEKLRALLASMKAKGGAPV